MGAMASQITDVSFVFSIVCSNADQRKHQSSASLALVRGIHRWQVNSPHKGTVTRKMFPFDGVIMNTHLMNQHVAEIFVWKVAWAIIYFPSTLETGWPCAVLAQTALVIVKWTLNHSIHKSTETIKNDLVVRYIAYIILAFHFYLSLKAKQYFHPWPLWCRSRRVQSVWCATTHIVYHRIMMTSFLAVCEQNPMVIRRF